MATKQRGFLLIFSLLVLTGLTALTTVSITRSTMDLAAANRFVASAQAFALAERGTDCAITQFRTTTVNATVKAACNCGGDDGADPPQPYLPCPLPNSTVRLTITAPSTTTRKIQSVATSTTSGQSRTLWTLVSRPFSPFQQAAYGRDNVFVTHGGLVDSYNSTLGAYDQNLASPDPTYGWDNISQYNPITHACTGCNGNVRTNSSASGAGAEAIRIKDTDGSGTLATVKGSAFTPAGQPAVAVDPTTGVLTGSASVPQPTQTFSPPVLNPPPSGPCTNLFNLTIDGNFAPPNRPSILPNACYTASSITVTDGGIVQFSGLQTLYVTGNTAITAGGALQLTSPASVGTITTGELLVDQPNSTLVASNTAHIYATGKITVSNSAVVTGFQNQPRYLRIYSTHSSLTSDYIDAGVRVVSNGKVYSTIYAPAATIKLYGAGGTGQIYGAAIGKTVETFEMGAALHYDEVLKTVTNAWPAWMQVEVTVLAQWNGD